MSQIDHLYAMLGEPVGSRDGITVAGACPACGQRQLILGEGGHLHCNADGCEQRDAADRILDDTETEHLVEITEKGYRLTHPLRERLSDDPCPIARGIHRERQLKGPGRYRVYENSFEIGAARVWVWEML